MFSTQRAIHVALAAALVAGLGGCALLEPEGSNEPLSGMAACALGSTWNLDTVALAAQVKADLVKRGLPDATTTVTAEGTQTLEWGLDSSVVLNSDYTLTATAAPAADQVTVVAEKHSGTSTGVAYISGEVAIPRKWDATGLAVTPQALLNGAPLEPVPFAPVATDIDDLVGLELTCDGGTLTTHGRGGAITQTWSKAG